MGGITAIILAAGMGVRMGPRGKLRPKGLFQVGGMSMVERSVATLREWGAGHIRIVTGHLDDQYRDVFGASDIELLHNPDFFNTGSLQSLHVGIGDITGPCVLLESDLIYAPRALDPIRADTNCLVTSDPTGAGDEVYIWTQSGTPGPLVGISKDRATRPEPHFGELVGITGLSADTLNTLKDVTAQVLSQSPGEHYETGLLELAHRVDINCVRLDNLPWAEIDNEEMYERAVRLVYPRIVAETALRATSWAGFSRRGTG